MKTSTYLKSLFFTGMFIISFTHVNSQTLQVTSAISPEEMVELLIGTGVDYSNVQFTGNSISRGSFWGGPGDIGLSNGIILTSGYVAIAPGPNNTEGAGASNNADGDPDLAALSGSGNSYDACVLEFDFVPFYEHLWFRFVFGSEEYHEFVNQYNDVFGFFISGPGISGPYSNNSANIALIPGTNLPVSINNVNNGPTNEGPCVNCQYFVPNTGQFCQYDAFTVVLTAEAIVVPMSTYHIKLAVGDNLDYVFDSGVFLQAASFCSGPVTGINTQYPDKKEGKLSIYPVPSGDLLHISTGNGQNYKIQLFGQDGRILKCVQGNSDLSLDMSDMPAGLYFLKLTSDKGVQTRKIFKK